MHQEFLSWHGAPLYRGRCQHHWEWARQVESRALRASDHASMKDMLRDIFGTRRLMDGCTALACGMCVPHGPRRSMFGPDDPRSWHEPPCTQAWHAL